ncbi:unnamed protein product [Adineta steineri]|uniref:SET domain-containing protein n=1 Tax=Adineta steineri TaxID=433720 RepID=A0A815PI78_9BILA|nr:unnamed protein product [Adineta steineri]CAF1449570.1 unnamed protein product [Adineta steineri]
MEDNAEFLIRSMLNLEKCKGMQGKKPTRRKVRSQLIQMHERYHSFENNSQPSVVHEKVTSLIYPPCTQPLSSLQRISLTDLVLETVHREKYLLLRTIVHPKKIVEIRTIVEDPNGDVDVLELYYQNPNRSHKDIIPNDSIIVLKEPYYKISDQGETSLRCDHPTDLIFLDANNPIVQDIKWKTGTPKTHKILIAAEYKTLGNDYFKQGKFYEAIKAYSDGISSSGISDPEISLLRLNRSQAQLKVNHFEDALNNCQDILKNDPNNVKALYRCIKALYGLENYDEALVQVKNLLKIDPKNVDAQRELNSIETRITEKRKGLYNFDQMIEQAKKSSTPCLDNASYVGPVQVAEISTERGRGLILTEDVRKGQLLLCCKAFAITYPTEYSEVNHFNAVTQVVETGDHEVNTAKVIDKIQSNPSLAPSLFQLYAGQHRIGETLPIATAEAIDSFWLSDICSMNTFGVSEDGINPLPMLPTKSEYSKNGHAAGLFLLPSLINHACYENVIRSYIGDMMIVRAAYDLTQGTELLLTYADDLLQYEERTKHLKKHKFICKCMLCELDRAEPVAIHRKRKILIDQYKNEYRSLMLEQIFQNPQKAIGDMLKMMTNIENTYNESRREKYRLGLIEPLLALGKMYGDTDDTQNAMECYKKLLKIHEFDLSTNAELLTRFLFKGVQELIMLYYGTSQRDKGQQLLKRLRQSLVVTPTGDDRIFVAENRQFFSQLFGVYL